jgi:hypothetical protein
MQSASGGGGLGDPIDRESERVLADFLNGLLTLETSQKVYCVSIDTQHSAVNAPETEAMRQSRIKARLSQGIPGGRYLTMLVKKRERREFSPPVLEFLDQIESFSPAFREQVEREKKLADGEFKPLGKVQAKRKIMDLTPYVKIIEDDKGRKIAACSKCDFAYSDVSEDYKLYCLIYERDPAEVYPRHLAPDKDWALYREFYCPQCGTQIEAEQCPPCMPIIQEAKLDKYE